MKVTIQIIVEHEELDEPLVEEIGCVCRGELLPETLGLTLQEGKDLLANIQATMVKHQAEEYVAQQRLCPHCSRQRSNKGTHEIVWRSLFGKLKIQSPRLYSCSCRSQEKNSFSPLADLLTERRPKGSLPELLYMQTKWASLMSYGLSAEILADVLPMQTNSQSVILNTQKVAARLEAELGEEQLMFAHGCIAAPRGLPEALPPPDGRLTVGLDGGYIRSRSGRQASSRAGEDHKAGWFEVIAGKSVPWEGDAKCFGFVNNYDEKPKRRLYEVLRSQGLQMNQDIAFLSDGGDTVRDLQLYISPFSEHVLDWFHITMRLTVMMNTAKGLPENRFLKDVAGDLERVKWYLWHGNVYRALSLLDLIESDLEICELEDEVVKKMYTRVREFSSYIDNNSNFIPRQVPPAKPVA